MKKIVLLSIIGIALLVAGIVTFQYFQSSRYVTVNFTNVKEVTLVKYRTLEKVSTIEKSGDTIRIDKSVRYKLSYIGNDGYATGSVEIESGKTKVDIKPYYSDEKLSTMLDATTLNDIRSVITTAYPKAIKNYTIEKGKLHHFGEWYTTSLVYKKGYSFDSDTLRVVLQKVSGEWRIVATPNITLDRFTNPTVPVDILREINNP